MLEVVIPAYNEEKTIRHIVAACLHAPSIHRVHVVIDNKTTDDTASAALSGGANIYRYHGLEGKGQLLKYGLQFVETQRVMFCDGDYTRFSPHIAEVTTAIHSTDTMRIVVPKMPTPAEWEKDGPPFGFNPGAWSMNSGLRSLPRHMVDDLDLYGYLTETQLNQAAGTRGITITHLYEPAFVQPLRFSEARLQAMETDRQWGMANGVLHA
jgi:glycosyltransferase involved in cell wall biosynthesis